MPRPPSVARLVASVILLKENKVLVIHEPDDEKGMRFNLPGGHIEPGEGLIEGTIREAHEETGLEVALEQLVQVVTNAWPDGTYSVRQTFLARILKGEAKAEEGSEIRWMTREEVLASPNEKWIVGVRDAIRLAFDRSYIASGNFLIRHQGAVQNLEHEV